MKKSKVLRQAKENLALTSRDVMKDKYVCYAVRRTDCPQKDKNKTVNYISELLHPCTTVFGWLFYKHNIDTEFCPNSVMQQYRLDWMNHMISELESKGE